MSNDGSASHAGSAAILLVDDHEDTVRVLQKLLRMSGFEVRVARTAEEALEVAAECPCDLIVSDVGLPDRSGLERSELNAVRLRRRAEGGALGSRGGRRQAAVRRVLTGTQEPVQFDSAGTVRAPGGPGNKSRHPPSYSQ